MVGQEHMSCSKNTKHCSQISRRTEPLGDCCRGLLDDLLYYVIKFSLTHGIPMWADYGTLLGIYQQGQSIPWDSDHDLGMHGVDTAKLYKLAGIVREDGYILRYFPTRNYFKFQVSRMNNLHVDVFIWYPVGDELHRLYYLPMDQKKGKEFPAIWLGDGAETIMQLHGHEHHESILVPCPAHSKKLLNHRYGHGWRTPLMGKVPHEQFATA